MYGLFIDVMLAWPIREKTAADLSIICFLNMRVQGKQPEKKLGFIDANVQVHVGNGLRIAVLVEDHSQSASDMAGNWKRKSMAEVNISFEFD